ncbi:hypothetical protein [Arthrobacter sp. 24S4-2]|uniref:hypothetical protein n=1 Tax=Arthrobacter sp. 24S4-2 TaxID=2575374 RepID=UPI001C300F20|nr:hypothetical protein [Arthrobacter sp. 24S4-2]
MCLSDRADCGQTDSEQAEPAAMVELRDVTDDVLEELLEVALTDAAPDDVTPRWGKLMAGTRNGSAGSAIITAPLLPDWTARICLR